MLLINFMPDKQKRHGAVSSPSPTHISILPPEGADTGTAVETSPTSGVSASVAFLSNVVYLMLTVMFIAMLLMAIATGTLMYDAWTNKEATYQDLRGQVEQQNKQIDTLTKALQQAKIIK